MGERRKTTELWAGLRERSYARELANASAAAAVVGLAIPENYEQTATGVRISIKRNPFSPLDHSCLRCELAHGCAGQFRSLCASPELQVAEGSSMKQASYPVSFARSLRVPGVLLIG